MSVEWDSVSMLLEIPAGWDYSELWYFCFLLFEAWIIWEINAAFIFKGLIQGKYCNIFNYVLLISLLVLSIDFTDVKTVNYSLNMPMNAIDRNDWEELLIE
jgi:hypothetical protein